MPADSEEAREFARSFRSFLDWVHQDSGSSGSRAVVSEMRGHVGEQGLEQSVVVKTLPPFEHVNLQAALNVWMVADGRQVTVRGLAIPPHYGTVGLHQLLHGEALPPVRFSAPDLVDLPSGPHQTLACVQRAVLLVGDARGSYALLVAGPLPHEEPTVRIEVAGLPTAQAQEVLQELSRLRSVLNVYRGHLLEFVPDPNGGVSITFTELPPTARDDVVLPERVLRRVERHTIDIAAHREALRRAGQHLKRGLLLYGPPGTGKTHTMRYLVQQLAGSTVLMLSGHSLHLIGMVTQLARDLQPAVLVLEDVDLVAEDRGFGPGASPVLFELLDAMDGAAADADLLFLLTTNRADLLEPALAARPGRVDVAVEIGLPDDAARRRLFDVYSRGVPLSVSAADVTTAVERTEGVTASFMKEMVRRAVLQALTEGRGTLDVVTGAHLAAALDDLLDSAQSVTRALLGVPADHNGAPQSAPLDRGFGGHRGMGWVAARPYASMTGLAYDAADQDGDEPLDDARRPG